ncbi:MAG: N-acetyl-gamma-glutamyl-phosphate reductase [Oscillospiraceae bacterium]|jgi:N-acetyl-gamma-glutamyl-phosphate reductase|nr:N-acetyl-gamma-glutamyl-phosphate reductase [Oscillospiraceae bacterium]
MAKVGIIGATGYAGAELVRLLVSHPTVDIAAISSVSFEGKLISEVYPSFFGFCDYICRTAEDVVEKSDVVFAALPHGMSQEIAAECAETGKIFIDLGADFRLDSEDEYKEWYNGEYSYPELHEEAVYGLPELFRSEIEGKRIIGNPGCYPTSIALALSPALKAHAVNTEGIILDSKSGVTGAGRGLTQTGHFPEANENFSPYKVASHRHTPEIEQTLSKAAGVKLNVTFVPHLLPVNRGILSTCYAKLNYGVDEQQIRELYERAYKAEYFVRLLPKGQTACIRNVKFSNFCDISLHIDERTGTLIVVSAIDNMVKGAAGQAIQNMNILLGLPETTGLEFVPPAF